MQNISHIMQDRIGLLRYGKEYAYSVFPEEIKSVVSRKNIECHPGILTWIQR